MWPLSWLPHFTNVLIPTFLPALFCPYHLPIQVDLSWSQHYPTIKLKILQNTNQNYSSVTLMNKNGKTPKNMNKYRTQQYIEKDNKSQLSRVYTRSIMLV